MNDYISRQTIMNAFAEYVRRSNNSDFAPTPTWNDAVEIVENLPSVDIDLSGFSDKLWHIAYERGKAETVRHGHWIISRFGADAKCSVCGYYFNDAYDMENEDNYCRHCGARMDGE